MRALGLLIVVFALSACGFRPLYGGQAGAARRLELGQISITPIDSKNGIDLRNELIDRITPDGEPTYPQYRLDIKLHEYREGLGIQKDSSVTRWNYQLNAEYQLFDLGTGKVITKGNASSMASYSVVDSQFATLSAENDAKQRASVDLGDQLELRLALFFEQRAH
jgi:LPS-assembly lipoprotein